MIPVRNCLRWTKFDPQDGVDAVKKYKPPLLVRLGYKVISIGFRLPSSSWLSRFDQQSRLADLLKRLNINIFLDVGANKGFFSKHLRMLGFEGHIFSFEPIPLDCDHIRMLADGDPRWRVCCYALGATDEQKRFNITLAAGHETVLSSFLPMPGDGKPDMVIDVHVRRLDEVLPDLIREIPNPRIFLKMDTQGFDGEVVAGASGCLSLVQGLQSEISVIPLYEGIRSYTQSLNDYAALGFELIDLFVVGRTGSGGVLEYDAVMARAATA